MKKYRVSVSTQVEVSVVIEADDEHDALQKTEDMDFELESSYGQGGLSIQPRDDNMSMGVGDPNYNNTECNEEKE